MTPGHILLALAALPAVPSNLAFTELETGIELVTITEPSVPWVRFEIALGFGSTHDPPDAPGLARIAGLALIEDIDAPGAPASLRVRTGKSATLISGDAPPSGVSRVLRALLERLEHPQPSEVALARALAVVEEEKQAHLASDAALARAAFERVLLPLPFGRSIIGGGRELSAPPRKEVIRFLDRHVGASTTIIATAGSTSPSPADVVAWTRGWKKRAVRRPAFSQPRPRSALELVIVDKPARKAAYIVLGRLTTGATDRHFSETVAAAAAIDRRLATELAGSVHAIRPQGYATLAPGRHASVFSLGIVASPSEAASALARVREVMDAISRRGLSSEEIAIGRAQASGDATLAFRDSISSLRSAIRERLLGVPAPRVGRGNIRIQKATDEGIRRMAQSLAAPDAQVAVIVAEHTTQLQADLGQIPGTSDISVVRYDR